MKKTLLGSILLVLALVLGAGMAAAQTPAPVCQAAAPALELPQAQVPVPADLFAPQPESKAICPLIGCANDQYCRRDRDCTTAPGGVCNLFCPTQGCCSYPG